LADTMHGDWRADVDWNRAEPTRELQLEQTRRQMEMERLRNVWGREDRQRALSEQTNQELQWRTLAAKMGAASREGASAVGWTAQDDMWADRLGVQMGYIDPRGTKSGGRSSKGSLRSDFGMTS